MMIDLRSGTVLNVVCNSGITKVRVIQIYKKFLGIGSKILASTVDKKPYSKIGIGIKVQCILIRTKTAHNRNGHVNYAFNDNAVVLTNKNWEMIGSSISGPVPIEIIEKYPSTKKSSHIIV